MLKETMKFLVEGTVDLKDGLLFVASTVVVCNIIAVSKAVEGVKILVKTVDDIIEEVSLDCKNKRA